jgi:3-hydroxyisobutyrate dehydrogenase
MTRVAFLGLGRMGQGMAGRLIEAGFAVSVYNRTARAAPLLARGARVAANPREAAQGAAAVVAMTADDESSRACWLGSDGALAADLQPNALLIECSTLSHDWVLEFAAQARSRGLRYIDSPVTGLPEVAAAGGLTLLVGADTDDLAAAQPFLTPLATHIRHFGAVGAGTAYKLMINLLGAIQIASVGEGLALAERAGLDLHQVVSVLETGQAASPQVVRNARRMAADQHDDPVFTPRLRLKDVEYALALARKLGLDMPFGQVSAQMFRALVAQGEADGNESRIIDIARGKVGLAT